jgi:hypothetical protein
MRNSIEDGMSSSGTKLSHEPGPNLQRKPYDPGDRPRARAVLANCPA